jgi:glycosyltransferase 2 family protein
VDTTVAASAPAVDVTESPPATAERSPADVLRVVVAAAALGALLLVQWLAGDQVVRNAHDLSSGLDTVPSWLVTGVVELTWLIGLAAFVGGAVVTVVHRRWRALRSCVVGVVLALVLAGLLTVPEEPTAAAVATGSNVLDWFVKHPTATELAVAVTAALATAAAPWVGRSWRRWAWLVVIGVMLGRSLIAPVGLASLRALLVGWLAGALAVLAFGAPPRRAGGHAIAAGLASVGVPVTKLTQASLDARGSTPWFAEAADGRRLFVKSLGRDERSADLLFRLYRRIVPRDLGDESGYLSLRRAVEHEALVALAARDLGVRTPRFVTLATAEPASFVLAYEAIDGRSLDRVEAAEVDDRLLGEVWEQVALLRAHRLAHRDLRLANVFVAADGAVWMIDFGFSELAASDTLLATDLAELLAATALVVGVDRSLAAARSAVGDGALATAADRLRPWALSGATRTALKAESGLLDQLRSGAAGDLSVAAGTG